MSQDKAGKPPTAPNPLIVTQGAYIGVRISSSIGGHTVYGDTSVGFNRNDTLEDKTDVSTFRPRIWTLAEDPYASQIAVRYDQNKISWKMVFSVVTDPIGGLIGNFFSLHTQSNYPMIDMSLPKLPIVQAGGGALQMNELPHDYLADIRLNFWQAKDDIPIDAWIDLEIGYVKPDTVIRKGATRADIDMVVLKKVRLMPVVNASVGPELLRLV